MSRNYPPIPRGLNLDPIFLRWMDQFAKMTTGALATADGGSDGLVPALPDDAVKFFRGDGIWAEASVDLSTGVRGVLSYGSMTPLPDQTVLGNLSGGMLPPEPVATADLAAGMVSVLAPLLAALSAQTTVKVKSTAVVSYTGTATLLVTDLAATAIKVTAAGAAAMTFPTGTALDAYFGALPETGFSFSVISTGAGAATMTASSGVTIIGSAIIASASSRWRLRRTAISATWEAVRLA